MFTTPFRTEANKHRNTKQFTKKNSRCQRGGVRGVANQNATTERTNLQTECCSKDEAAALRKTHVVRPYALGFGGTHSLAQDDFGMRLNRRINRAKGARVMSVAFGGGSGIEHLRDDIIILEA